MTDSAVNGPTASDQNAPQPVSGRPPVPPVPPYPPYTVGTAGSPPPAPPYVAPGYPQQVYGVPPQQQYAPQPQAYPSAPQAYAPPVGYAAPPQGYGPYTPTPTPAPRAAGGAALGVVALVLAILAALGATVVGSLAGYSIGTGTGRDIMLDPTNVEFDWSILTPVRGWVLVAELSFWAGTILGVWAIVQGIVATVKNQGRGWGIAAIIVALIGPIVFVTGVQAFLAVGFAAGASG